MATLTSKIIPGRGFSKISGLYVEVWTKNISQDHLLGDAVTNTQGGFSILYDERDFIPTPGAAGPLVYVKVYHDDQLIKNTVENPVGILRNTLPDITITSIDDEGVTTRVVRGIIATPKGRGMANLIVRANHKTNRTEIFLSEGRTNNKGAYIIYYNQAADEGRTNAADIDLLVKAFTGSKEKEPVIVSPLIINALPLEIINLSVGEGAYQGLDTYTFIHESLEDSITEKSLNDLTARDALILANTHNLEASDVSYYIQARQWEAQWKGLPAEVYFGWFKNDLTSNWRELISIPVEKLISGIDEAISENYIPDTTEKQKQGLEEKIKQWRTDNLVTAKGQRVERGSIGELLSTSRLNETQKKQLFNGWQNFDGTVDEFWRAQQKDLGPENYKDLELTLQLGAVTRNHLPLIQSIKNTRINKIQDIALLHQADWLQILEAGNMAVPDDIPGEDLKSKRTEFAFQLRNITEELVPTAVLANSFRADREVESGFLDQFIDRNPEFEFRTKTLRSYLKENPDALGNVGNKEAVQKELEAVQRIFHLTPTKNKYKGAKVLWQNQLHSAYAIKMTGLSALTTLFNGDLELATDIYNKASMRHGQTKMVKMQLQTMVTPVYAIATGFTDLVNEFDNAADLEALFGDQGYCKCKHCDSFFSPSAYLTDLFLYLHKIKVNQSGAASDEDTALEKLFKRRPDLGNIELDCENSHTPLPYIDLVNEVMEASIVPNTYQNEQVTIFGKNYTLPVANTPQTESDAPTLKAYPQYNKQEAYTILSAGENNQTIGFPWILPFNLWMLELRTYLEHLGVSRANLMRSILGGAINSDALAAEYLTIIPEEQVIFADTTANATTTQKYWGTTTGELSKVPVFLAQTGYSYEKLTKLLRMRYVQPVEAIVFNPPSSCSIADASIPGLTDAALSRMHKFGRLLLKTNEDMHVLDRTILAFGGEIDNDFFIKYADLLQVEKLVKKIDRKELLSWWAPIEREDYKGDPSLYTKLFRVPEILEAFTLNVTKDELLTPGISIDPQAPPLVPDHLATILSATRLKAKDLELLVTDEFPNSVITLNLSQLSYLYRTASFCRFMKLTITEYLALKNVLGFQPLTSIDQSVNPDRTLAFIKKYNTLKKAGLDAETLNYILRHHSRPEAPVAIADAEIDKKLRLLQATIQTQLKEAFPPDTTKREMVEAKLKIIIGTNEPEDVEKVLTIQNIIAGTSMLSIQEQNKTIDEEMVFFRDKQEAKNKLTGGALTNTDERFAFGLQAINLYLLENAVIQQLSESMELPQKVMLPLLQKLMVHPSDSTKRAIDVFLDDLFINADPDPKKIWKRADLPNQFFVMIKLYKIGLLITALNLEPPDIVFLMENGNTAGIPDFNALPVEKTALVTAIDDWIALFNLVLLNREVFKGEDSSVFDILKLSKDTTVTKEILLQKLNDLTGWKLDDLLYLTGVEGLNLVFPQDYANGQWLIRIGETLKLVDRVGATAKQMSGWALPNITKTQADSVRHAAMARYGEEQWQAITVPLRNNIREAQRDALVQYVLHYRSKHNGKKFEDIDDIYGYYLIDTQMAACTDTSRIVLASSSVQLFVQRVMMNLESGMSLTPEFMNEWKWRKYYRVWEANRKVFMWPENWIEPELRDDKTPFFKELENDLLQGELNSESVEKAYVSYLEKLHQVSHLKVCGMYEETDTFHVIAKTSGIPELYYYRRWEDQSQWTPWEKIELDIFNGEEIETTAFTERGILITPIVHNRRLFLFWPLFKIKKEPPTKDDENQIETFKTKIDDLNSNIRKEQRRIDQKIGIINSLEDKKRQIKEIDSSWTLVDLSTVVSVLQEQIVTLEAEVDVIENGISNKKAAVRWIEESIRKIEQGYLRYKISMAWSQYQDGIWTPKKVSQKEIYTPLFVDDFKKGASLKNYIVAPKITEDGTLQLWLLYSINKKNYKLASSFEFNDCKSEIEVLYGSNPSQLYDLKEPMSFMKGLSSDKPLNIVSAGSDEILLLEKTLSKGGTIKSLQGGLSKTKHPFFYEDSKHSFFIHLPSKNNTGGKSPSSIKTVALNAGTNSLQSSAYKLIASSEEEPQPSAFQFTSSYASDATFFGSAQSNQVIVRAKDDVKSGSTKSAEISFGMAPAQNSSQVSQVSSPVFTIASNTNGYSFYPFYHPYTCLFLKQLNRFGIDGLLNPNPIGGDGQELLYQATPSQMTPFDFKKIYKPNFSEVNWLNVKEEIDFKHGGVYATYNWELFYHIPLFIATRLSQDQRFDEAQKWFHYIFDPTEPQGELPYRFWKIKPFHTYTITAMKNDIEAVMNSGEAIKKQIKAWEENPFNPHLLARFRRLAYMKTVVMKYLDNLIAWGDQLFRMDSIESMNEATQLYILAGQILGKLPVETEAKPRKSKSFNQLAAQLTQMGNAWVNLENSMTNEYEEDYVQYSGLSNKGSYLKNNVSGKLKDSKTKTAGSGATTGILDDILYFCMSPNEKLLSYWDTVADRLFKIRNCMNIEGLIRSVPLFQPPIDPALLVRAAAAGMDISSAINDLYAPMPFYRFQVLVQKAQELCQELKSLGGGLLSALEKKDAEQLSLIRSQHEIQLLVANKDIKKQQMEEARLAIASLEESYKLVQIRYDNYSDRDFMNTAEVEAKALSTAAILFEIIAGFSATSAATVSQVPDIKISTHAQMMSSGSSVEIHPPGSGDKNEKSAMSFSSFFNLLASVSRQTSGIISTQAGYDRRKEDWDLQIDLAEQEMKQIDRQILGALVRKEISLKEKENLDLQIENSKLVDAYMRNKYTNQELYSWFIGQISAVYFQTYKMAYDMAKQAEKAFRFELGIDSSNYIKFGYWDNLRKGLLSGEKLHHDLKRLELAYLEKNKREYELTKHVSLYMLDPVALVTLKATGVCNFEIPEVLYDMDHPGQYFRRIKSVSISLPCIAGPYTSISARLSLINNKYRKNTNPATQYAEESGNDERFIYNVGAIQSIAASTAQNDSGMFELNFRDERYLPFENTGAVSSWRLELPQKEISQFNYDTISDLIIHVKYTAREGGTVLKELAAASLIERTGEIKQQLNQTGLHLAINMKHDLPNEWHLLKTNGLVDLKIDKSRLPYFAQSFSPTIDNVLFIAKVKNNPAGYAININETPLNLARIDEWKLCHGAANSINIDALFQLTVAPTDITNLEDLMMVVKYKV
jgi:Tc toxin complex TcA C-terminal TcB-binding domain/Neuraminidase-like domain/Salmonella virulence plasmid 28.1kDa A protein